MTTIERKFSRLATDNAPGQEVRQSGGRDIAVQGAKLEGRPVDFSHGDVDAHEPTPGAFEAFAEGVSLGGAQAYTEYRGDFSIRAALASRLADFTGATVDAADGLIITPGTQGALFLAVAATVARGDKVAVVQPDYFANRKIVEFVEGTMLPIQLHYREAASGQAGLDLDQLEDAFRSGAKLFLFSNPNNPTGVVYSAEEIGQIAALATGYGATIIVDQLYSRLRYSDVSYMHVRASDISPESVMTIMGPSKTESLSGYRVGVAFGSQEIISRMEKLQAIVSLRAAGYSQAVLRTWFAEPEGWLAERIAKHEAIRDDLVGLFSGIAGCFVRAPDAGSYLFPSLPNLRISYADFIRTLRLRAGVIVTPGTEFGPHSSGSVRLNFSQDHAAAVGAVERLARLVDEYRA